MGTASQLRDNALFYRQLATTLDAGLSPIEALNALSTGDGAVSRRARWISETVRDPHCDLGSAVADGEGSRPLGRARATVLRTAWGSGYFVEALRELSQDAEERLRTLRKLRIALIRPAATALAIPVILSLPALVQGGIPGYLAAAAPGLMIIAAAVGFGMWISRNSAMVPRRVPVFGPLARESAWARAALVLHYFFQIGSAPGPALREGAKAAGPGPEGEALLRAAAGVERGASMAQALPPGDGSSFLLHFLRTGETSGTLGEMTGSAAKAHEEEAIRMAQRAARWTAGICIAVSMAWAAYKILQGWMGYFSAINQGL